LSSCATAETGAAASAAGENSGIGLASCHHRSPHFNDKNESLGSINDLLTDKTGNIKAVIIGVGG
jgi:hypothetical protein